MKRKDYRKPTTKVVEVRHAGMLMTSTQGTQANRSGYGAANTDDWE